MDAREPMLLSGGGCCPVPAVQLPSPNRVDPSFVRDSDGRAHVDFLVPDMHCAACLGSIETRLAALPGVTGARANLTSHRVGVDFEIRTGAPDDMLSAIEGLGYTARPFDAAAHDASADDAAGRELVRALAVAGFAAGNVMLLSVSVWSGAEDATRDLFHWLSALIALPAIAYAGRPFFRSAIRAVMAGRLNMDVPISIGVLLTAAISLYETAIGGPHAYFDAAIGLLFFLLVGRYLDHRMRAVARSAAARLMSLSARSAMLVEADGSTSHVPLSEIVPGDHVRVVAGERVAVDGTVAEGASDIDRSLLTGEPDPEAVSPGGRVFAGTLNLTGPLTIAVTAKSDDTLLAEIVRLMEAAERSGSRHVRLADRVSRIYAPAVHILALATLVGWLVAGAGWHMALTTAVAVLVITCPCALGLAVPAVQVVASGFLLGRGIMLKDGGALERLATVDLAVFDKTGTLTEGTPRLVETSEVDAEQWAIAAALGGASRHPLATALAETARERGIVAARIDEVSEHPGEGMEGRFAGTPVRLGRLDWVGGGEDTEKSAASALWLRIGDQDPVRFAFEDRLREDATDTLSELRSDGLLLLLLSGDRAKAVAAVAARTGIASWRAGQRPAEKAEALAALAAAGRHVLMVGDGLNDAPALAGALVSMSPLSAADISQTAADIVFTGRKLAPVATALRVARTARRLIFENFALAIAYNVVAVPLAILGLCDAAYRRRRHVGLLDRRYRQCAPPPARRARQG